MRNEQAWTVAFEGEGSIDVGGPYRESLVALCSDLMSPMSPLFLESPNGHNKVGLNREKWVLHPGARSARHLAMFEFLGAVMGMVLRTGDVLPLHLPSGVWKQILGQQPDEMDLEAVDKLCVQAINTLRNQSSPEAFEQIGLQHFTTQLSDNTLIELVKNGARTQVDFARRHEFCRLTIEARINEAIPQVTAIRRGINHVVPLPYLRVFSHHDLETAVCGHAHVDINVLKYHTVYSNSNANSPAIKFLWATLEEFHNDERQLFLQFVWGRNRLPSSDYAWPQPFTINLLDSVDDNLLPVAHTCFFSIDLPNYSCQEVLSQKLHFAILHCTAIDADFNPQASSLNAWVD